MQVEPNSKTIIVGTGVISDASWKYEVNQQSAEMGGRLFQSLGAAKKKDLSAAEARNLWFILCSTRQVVSFDDRKPTLPGVYKTKPILNMLAPDH